MRVALSMTDWRQSLGKLFRTVFGEASLTAVRSWQIRIRLSHIRNHQIIPIKMNKLKISNPGFCQDVADLGFRV